MFYEIGIACLILGSRPLDFQLVGRRRSLHCSEIQAEQLAFQLVLLSS